MLLNHPERFCGGKLLMHRFNMAAQWCLASDGPILLLLLPCSPSSWNTRALTRAPADNASSRKRLDFIAQSAL
jgi:hypothetical protein